MSFRYDHYNRLEPAQPYENLAKGFRAEAHDPLWFLAQQWLMGEHQGEDASSPVKVRYRVSHTPIEPVDANTDYDPGTTPPEAIVESEPGDWWTPGRRVRIGIALSSLLPTAATTDPTLLLQNLPAPYHRLNGKGYDGQKIYANRVALGLGANPLFSEVPDKEPLDLWESDELIYNASFQADQVQLEMRRHSGGHVDWFSVDADAPIPAPQTLPNPSEVLAAPIEYPGAPNLRWWEIENHKVDIGGFPPDRSHFATMLLIDLIASHSDDWFTFPVGSRSGAVATLEEVVVRDSFDEEYVVAPPTGWHMFHVEGLRPSSLVVWPTVTTPLKGRPIEDVIFGIDEDSNLLLAVERRLAGRDVPTPAARETPVGPTDGQVQVSGRKRYSYRTSSKVAPNWHPYVVKEVQGRRRFVQARLADLEPSPPELTPEPQATILFDPNAAASDPVHQIEPATVPPLGMRIERRWLLARRTDGTPVLWLQRRRFPLLVPPALDLRFDVAREKPSVRPT